MSMASTIPSMRLSCSATSSSSTTAFRRVISKKPSSTVIRSSQAEGPLRRPVAPLREPTPPLKPVPPTPPSSSSPILSPPPSPSPPTKPATAGTVPDSQVPATVTIEFQRRMAKELQEYFREKKVEEANEGPAFGFLGKNEIANGRWAMFGFAVGLLTEYATGSDFVDQVKILLSNFGIVDLE
ncbi:hypothetical protein EJ110_NYTH33809 [Nymphaea thermarum]|nr:hypothetical protein EJ110_NYTH33809 [Nymphaea thermarum]